MIKLYDTNTTTFLGAVPDAISCQVEETLNGSFELRMQYPVNGLRFNDLLEQRIISCKPNPYASEQMFEIYRIVKSMSGTVDVYASHISYRLSKIPVAPFTAASLSATLSGLVSNAMEACPFTFTTDKSVASPYVQTVPASLRQRLGGEEGSVLDLYGGEYEWDNWAVKLWNHRGQDRGVTIRYGKNLTSLTRDRDIADVYTGVVPYWVGYNDEGKEVSVSSPTAVYTSNASSYAYARTIPLDMSNAFDEEPTQAQLVAKAQQFLEDNNAGIPNVSLQISFIDLRKTLNYADVAPLEQVMLGDTVSVYFPQFETTASERVVKTVYNVLADNYDNLELGTVKSSLADTIISQETATQEAVTSSKTFFEQALDSATELIRGGYGGYVIMQADEETGFPNEILIMDTPSTATAVNCIRINKNGIAFSQSGYNGTFTSAWTIDGRFLANNVTVVDLNATSITAGALKSTNYDSSGGQNGFMFDLESGHVYASDFTVSLNNVEADLSADIDAVREDATYARTTADDTARYFRYGEWGSLTGAGVVTGNNMVLVTATQLLFIQNRDYAHPVAMLDQQKLKVTHGIFNDDLQIGRFKFIPRSDGHLSFVYVGEDE